MKTMASPLLRSDQVRLSTTAEPPWHTRGPAGDTGVPAPHRAPTAAQALARGNPVSRQQGLTQATLAHTSTPHTCTGPCAPQPRGRSWAMNLIGPHQQSGSSRNPVDARSTSLAPEPQPTTLSQDRSLRHRCEQDPTSSNTLKVSKKESKMLLVPRIKKLKLD